MGIFDLAEAIDGRIADRLQDAYDRAWDAYGVTLGNLVCGLTVGVMGIVLPFESGTIFRIGVVITLSLLVFGSLHAMIQRRGDLDRLNVAASEIRSEGVGFRLGVVALHSTYGASCLAGIGTAGLFATWTLIVVAGYAMTVMVRPRKPPVKEGKVAWGSV